MIARLGDFLSRVAGRVVPDPFIFALVLTLATLCLGVVLTPTSPGEMVTYWMKGFWDLLEFGMQMVLILVTGGVLAQSPPIRRLINALAGWPKSTAGAVYLVSLAAMTSALVNWGLGLIVGALLAKETAVSLKNRGIPHHYPLIGAAGYTGLLVWHGGLSGSAPLSVATQGHFLAALTGVIPVSDSLFGSLNISLVLTLLITTPLILRAMVPKNPKVWIGVQNHGRALGLGNDTQKAKTLATLLEESPVLVIALCIAAIGYLFFFFLHKGLAGLNLNSMNACFLFLGMLFFLRPIRYVRAVASSVAGASGIILQFPFYAGIMGMMRDSGLVEVFSTAMVSASNSVTFPALSFLSAGVVNLFVPSGGGQWAVQGPILIKAASQLHVPPATTVMALAYGDQWTNMLQPFWALPLLAITGLQARQIIGYTAALMFLVGPLIVIGLLVL